MEFGKYLAEDFRLHPDNILVNNNTGQGFSISSQGKVSKGDKKYSIEKQEPKEKNSYLGELIENPKTNKKEHVIKFITSQKSFALEWNKQRKKSSVIDFSNCIFTIDVDLRKHEIDKEINFSGSIFKGNINLSGKNIPERCNFSHTSIEGNFNIESTVFAKPLKMTYTFLNGYMVARNAEFKEYVTFNGTEFKGQIRFEDSQFKTAYFRKCIMNAVTNFTRSKFNNGGYFQLCRFKDNVQFGHAEFKSAFNLFSCIFDKSIDLNFAKINKLNLINTVYRDDFHFVGTDFGFAYNRETYRILKHENLKVNDSIKAFDFYILEMKKYLEELKNPNSLRRKRQDKNKFSDKILLSFEKYASHFGSNPVLPTIWFLIVHYIATFLEKPNILLEQLHIIILTAIIWLILLFSQIVNKKKKIREILNDSALQSSILLLLILGLLLFNDVVKSILEVIKFKYEKNHSSFTLLILFIKSIISYILIYEIIKSFRKYSRKI